MSSTLRGSYEDLQKQYTALRAENARLREERNAAARLGAPEWSAACDAMQRERDEARTERDAAYERAAEVACPWCAGKGTYSRKPTVARDHEGLMHLAQGYPPRECRSAAIRALKAQPLPESEEEKDGE